MPILRAAEWINLLTFSGFVALAWLRRDLGGGRRAAITVIGAASVAVTLAGAVLLPRLAAPRTASICRDWIPYPLVGMFYWQAGRFVTRADVAFEAMLERADRRLVIPTLEWCARRPVGAWILAYLELAYLAYYVSLPGSLAALYWCGRRSETDHLWTAVLLSAYASCGALVFLQTRPPRLIGEKMPLPSSRLRLFNLWILRHGSVQTNTCPSAHVAIATACALILLRACPGWVGPVFLAIAISIALGAVAGRYHYAADAIAGVLVAVAAFAAETVLAATGA